MSIKNAVVKILKEFVILEKMKDDFEILPTSRQESEPFVLKHYLETFPSGIKRIYGIYKKIDGNRQMIGVIIYGVPFYTVGRFLEPEVKPTEILELKRLFIDDIGIKNLESFVIGQSLKLLKRDEPSIKVVVTFADDNQGHKGTIYQATNAIYLGMGSMKHKYIYIIGGDVDAIKNKIQNVVKQYPKKAVQEVISYNDIGHNYKNKKNKISWWYNDTEELHVRPADRCHGPSTRSDFEGRYDADKNMISIVDMGEYRKSSDLGRFNVDNTDIKNVPENLIRRLKFEFGDNTILKSFFEGVS